MDRDVVLSVEAKRQYLTSLIGKVLKILHLIEEEPKTGFSPKPFISGQLFEVNAANTMFNGALVSIVIKLNGVLENYESMSFADTKRQLFEIKKIINYQLKMLGGDCVEKNN